MCKSWGQIIWFSCPASCWRIHYGHEQCTYRAIQKVLGHENRTTTEIYLHNIGNAERQAIEAYEQARTKSLT